MTVEGLGPSGFITILKKNNSGSKGIWKLPGGEEKKIEITFHKDLTAKGRLGWLGSKFSSDLFVQLPRSSTTDATYFSISKKEWSALNKSGITPEELMKNTVVVEYDGENEAPPDVVREFHKRTPRLCRQLQENDESVANDFFLAGRTLYSIICRREKDGRISAKLTDESRVLSQQFSFDDAENISRIVGEKFHELSENARAYNEKLPVKKGTRRQEVSVWRPEIGKRVVYSIKCRKKEDGFFSIEASKVLGSGFSKVVPRCLDVAESCFTHVLMKLIKSPTPLTDVQRRERSENLRRELGYMMLFHKDPEFVHCHKILVKPHQFKEGSVELVRGAWVEECDGGNLLSFLNSRAFLSDSMRLDFAIAAARGLVKMHGKKLCHGDIKSANFLLKTEGGKLTLKISDFGSTKPFGEKGVLSDRQYAPPEYGPNSLATPQQDTYSLGLSLLELYLGPQANPMGEAVAILRSVLVQDALKKSEKARPSPAVGYYGGHRSKDGDRPAEVSKESQSDKILGEGYANVEKKRVEMERSPNPSLRLISRMLHRDPNDRPSMEEVLEELVAIKNQLEGREGVL